MGSVVRIDVIDTNLDSGRQTDGFFFYYFTLGMQK
jgi:hypothetical protein